MVHLKRTTSSTSSRGITTYTTIIPKTPYHSAPQDLRRSFRHELIDDCFPNVSQYHGGYETGGKARRMNDWLDGESDWEHERGVAREKDKRIRRGSRGEVEEGEMAEDADFDGDGDDGGREGEEAAEKDREEEEEDQNDDEPQDELEQQLRRESGVSGGAMGRFTYDEGNTPQFMEQMRQHISISPPTIPTISADADSCTRQWEERADCEGYQS